MIKTLLMNLIISVLFVIILCFIVVIYFVGFFTMPHDKFMYCMPGNPCIIKDVIIIPREQIEEPPREEFGDEDTYEYDI